MTPTTHPLFWRDAALPYVELRQTLDGREVSYAPHFHKEWSIGAILEGRSKFICAERLHNVGRGDLVMMNPNTVHACNPLKGSPWAYYMMYLDKDWLASLLLNAGVRSSVQWQNTHVDTLATVSFYQEFVAVCNCLMSAKFSTAEKDNMLKGCLLTLFSHLDNSTEEKNTVLPLDKLYQVANYLSKYCLEDTTIVSISAEFGLSTGYLIRAFKRYFNLTPHAYRLNCRVQLSQPALKAGQAIAKVAHTVGFSDQAHFQRVFKQRVAATPDQYRRSVSQI